ncbi:TPA: hypothetical protein DCY43_03105 [candidate division WWE3 bacterium]|uniref:General secretion pathway protein G n=4 Tax=Katanobacteria TaxID=422282 RepID=A0A0G1HG66_UNCKA|nr:MAG: hypothetical protein UW36_C0004G0015 [candidate division WWE3 bacterium GW2011_GWA2_44_16]KKT69554.1 MAG: hypothetical protein UW65_C0020G0003 [candidate division WWE3 bacterium GW2011_GWB1_44_4]HAZ29706.1 hypothetical protein [candidate division WWE3 bacterium]
MTRKAYTKGFTLVELLVVIAIVVILAGALFLIINPANLLMKARDSKRVSELTELNKALALALADNRITITTTATLSSCGSGTSGFSSSGAAGNWVQFAVVVLVNGGLNNYLSALPKDPTNVAPNCYYYEGYAPTSAWELNAELQSADNDSVEQNDGGGGPNAATRFEIGTDQGLDLI